MSRNILSDSQFAERDGASRRLSDKSEGPKSGYYVSRDPDTHVSAGGSNEIAEPITQSNAAVVGHHFDEANREGARTAIPHHNPDEVYQGGWQYGGKQYLDVSDRYSRSTSGLMHALQNGMANVQLGMWTGHGPKGKEYATITQENSEGEKTGVSPNARMVANSLHAQEVQRAVSRRPAKQLQTKNQRDAAAGK